MTGRGFERLFSSRVVRYHVNGVQTPNAFQGRPGWASSKLSALFAANASKLAQTTPFAAKKAHTASIMPDASLAAIAGIIVTMAHSSDMANR
jgi:hypothetical protein